MWVWERKLLQKLSHNGCTNIISLTNIKREQQGCPKSCAKKVVRISLLLIK